MTVLSAQSMGAVVDVLPLHLAVLDANGTIVQVNAAWRTFARQNGLPLAQGGPGTNYLDVCRTSSARGDPYAERALAGLLGILGGTTSGLSFEYPCDAPDLTRWFVMQASPCRVGDQTGAVVVHLDVTARRRAEAALQNSEAQRRQEAARLQFILDLSVDAICCIDGLGHFISVSASAERLWGRPLPDIVGKPWLEFVESSDRALAREALIELQSTGRSIVFQTRCVHRDHRPLHVEWAAQWSSAQQVTVAVARNVTKLHTSSAEHQEAINALRQSEERFRLIARVTSDAVFEWDAATGHLWWSQGLGGVFGDVSANWQEGFKAWERRVHPDDLERVNERFRRAV
ncbi:MAG: PAS domain S-box protein, partial [Panacagrimonas sp.]